MLQRRPPRHGLTAALIVGALALATPAGMAGSIDDARIATKPAQAKVHPGHRQRGIASYYGPRFEGKKTASGEPFDSRKMTAAHRTLPLGTRVRVTDNETGRTVVVRVNDRGPYVPGRAIDLSRGAGRALGMISEGLADVTIEVLSRPPES